MNEPETAIESWLSRQGRSLIWNSKHTVAKASIFNIPDSLVVLPSLNPQTNNDHGHDEKQSLVDSSVIVTITDPTEKGKTCVACGLHFYLPNLP